MTHLGVHRICEVDRRGVDGQRDNSTLRCEHEDFFLFKVVLEVGHELVGVSDI